MPLTKHQEVDPSELPAVKVAARWLFDSVQRIADRDLASGTHFGATVESIKACVKDHRRACKYRGIPFPAMTVLTLPIQGGVEILRTDLDFKSVQTLVLNLTQKYPNVGVHELARAIAEAFPQHNPKHINMELRRKPRIAEAFH